MKDDFGNRMKELEGVEAKRMLDPSKPIIVRVDGKGFSRFTKMFKKPFDDRLSNAMQATCLDMVQETGAAIGYVQSDEITLAFRPYEDRQSPIYGARISKLDSLCASLATSSFIKNLSKYVKFEEFIDKMPRFDGRSWNVPDESEGTNAVLWRFQDAVKNGVSCAYRWTVGKNMHKKDRHDMMAIMAENGIDYFKAFSDYERHGCFFKAMPQFYELPDEVWNKIPEDKRPDSRTIVRKAVTRIDVQFNDMTHEKRKEFVFGN